MEKAEIVKTLVGQGWVADKFGNYKSKTGQYRIKMQAISLRVEKRVEIPASTYSKAEKLWVNISSDYFCNLSVKDGRLIVGNKILKSQVA